MGSYGGAGSGCYMEEYLVHLTLLGRGMKCAPGTAEAAAENGQRETVVVCRRLGLVNSANKPFCGLASNVKMMLNQMLNTSLTVNTVHCVEKKV